MMDAKARILGATANEEEVDGPAGVVLVRGMSVRAKDRVQIARLEGLSWRGTIARECMLDPKTREPMFTADDPIEDAPAEMVEPYIDAAIRLSAFAVAEVEELEKNSERTPNGDTGLLSAVS